MEQDKNYYAVIMAGGVGSRFWPLSTTNFPKQFHDIIGAGETLIQATYKRIAKLVPEKNILILTNSLYKDLVNEQLPLVDDSNIVLEPTMRNTAPAILLAALKIFKINKNAAMVVAPSDHWIDDEKSFAKDLKKAFKACKSKDSKKGNDQILITLGIKPTFPHTGYGYIGYKESKEKVKVVEAFTEKPNYDTARHFIAQGNYLWNAGIFIWNVTAILEAFKKYLPKMYNTLSAGVNQMNTPDEQSFVDSEYPKVEEISIDYGILEKSQNVSVIPASFDWSDLGAWGSLYDKLDKNKENNVIINAQVVASHASGNIVRTQGDKIVVLDGLNDFVVVDNDDVLLIVPKSQEQQVKQIRKLVKDKYGDNLV